MTRERIAPNQTYFENINQLLQQLSDKNRHIAENILAVHPVTATAREHTMEPWK